MCARAVPSGLPTPEAIELADQFEKPLGRGMDVGGKWATTGEHFWVPWTNVHVIKAGVEASGWKSRDDNPKLIETLEGMAFKAGPGFPAGDMVIRPQDHRAFRDYYIEQIQGDHYVLVKHFNKEMGMYPPPVDLRKKGF